MGGASLAAVQAILGHSTPTITARVYAHLTPGYLQGEINRLTFGLPTGESENVVPVEARAVANISHRSTVMLPGPDNGDRRSAGCGKSVGAAHLYGGVPEGIRTPVAGVKGRCPGPG